LGKNNLRLKGETSPCIEQRQCRNCETQPHEGPAKVNPNFVREHQGVAEVFLSGSIDDDAADQTARQSNKRTSRAQLSAAPLQTEEEWSTDQ
jgi:hypothetical protein